jgi:ABC-type Mn2+/Zn2+ transport system permease subunit
LVWLFEIRTSLPTEALVGIIFVGSLAIGFLIVPELELLEALFGDISKVSFETTLFSVAFSILIFLVANRIYPKMILANISEDLAKSEGIKIKKQNFIYLLSIAVMVALGVKIVGSLLVGALVVIPAATSRNLSKNLKAYSLGSAFIGVLSCFLGTLLFKTTSLPAGPVIILTAAAFFLISLIFKR